MITIDQEQPFDSNQIDILLDTVFGDERFSKSSHALRVDNPILLNLSLVARDGDKVVGTVRFCAAHIHDMLLGKNANAVFLGPLAIHPEYQGSGLGSKIMRTAMAGVKAAGHKRVLLVGDAAYYQRFGFESVLPSFITLPTGKERRLLIAKPATVRALPAVGKVLPGFAPLEASSSEPRFGELAPAA
ncbi:N-acetyltransferase [Kordiimonas sp. SCSIO 12603]|uniref:GNAT family N-acetyltransferase n=1 Tax=Kordiimonas sp. SCSIO 12603 TaxID=2829596 RepID=UPI0021074157|nr:N-acetyltransferase [Kordiimonas sp. SCSIO 12603]UTW57924.1 N-acetyltransferase [Kordiimonas sp. SCSIO 12603]